MNNLNHLRLTIVRMIRGGGEGHIPSSFSILEIVYAVHHSLLRRNSRGFQDKFVLSKGHGAAALYVVLADLGIISQAHIENYGKPGSVLGGHPDRAKISGVEANTGSLGHGMPFAVGLSLANKIRKEDVRVYCLVGDGECQEGTIWEAANVATNNYLDKLVVFVDWNGSAAQLQPIENLKEKWNSFGWETHTCDGNSVSSIIEVVESLNFDNRLPKVILAETIKGKGVSFLEGHGIWHHKIPNDDQMIQIELELSK